MYPIRIWEYSILNMVAIVINFNKTHSNFALATLWVPSTFLTCDLTDVLQGIPKIWSYSLDVINSVDSGDSVFAARKHITIVKDTYSDETHSASSEDNGHDINMGYEYYIRKK